ncbi:MAG: hypothetical protein CL608_25715 [Anaerolineaceae bacterium]|nr:hypothetical protein [Anaerolineaceae bacterium]
MTTLHIELLGGFRLRLDNNPITLKTRKAESALAYLACGERPFSREELAASFWPQSEPSQAAANLRKLLSELRRDLAPYLLIDRQSVAIDPTAAVWLDVVEFSRLAAAEDPGALATAVSLYHGDFLAGFYLRDSHHFDEWATLERERHQQVMLRALHRLVIHHFHQGTYEEALPYISRWLALNPLAETAHRLAMRLHARRGRRNLALAQFMECQRILEEELGVSPAPETVQLHQRIREAPPQPFNFPSVLPNLVGRQTESSQISRLLEDTAVRLLTLTGPGGIGKTSLALHAASRCLTDFQHGVYLISLENVAPGTNSQEAFITTLAAAIQLPFTDKQTLQKQMLHYLAPKELLLLLDNFEQFTAAANFLKTLLAHAPGIKCLVTSQLPLNLPQETTLPLSGLPYANSGPGESSNQLPALALFESSANQVAPQFALTTATIPHVNQICQLVDGLPLALELAARAVRAFAPAQIAQQLQQDPDFLTSRSRDLPDRHRGLRPLFNCTWALLSPAEQTAFANLTIFPAPFTTEAAHAIAGVGAASLQKLVEKGLLLPGEANQHQMHNLLRYYGREKLVEYEDAAQLQAGYAQYYGRLLHQIQPDLDGARQNETLQTIRQNLPHARHAWQWGIEQANVPLLAQIVPALCRYFAINGLYQEAADWLERTIASLDESQVGETAEGNRLMIQCLTERGAFLCGLAAYETAVHTLTTALEKAQSQHALLETAACYCELGNLALTRGQLDQAEQQLNQSLHLYQEADNQRGLADVWHRLGQLHVQLSQPEKAHNAFSQSLTLCRQLAYPQGIAQALSGLALVVHYWTGLYTEAEPLYLEALAVKRELGHKHGMANDLNNLGNLACNLEAFDQAIAYYEESLTIKRKIGLPLGIAITLANLGTAYHELAEYERAGELYEESLGISQKLGDQLGVLFCLGNLAELAQVQGEYARSERRWWRVMQLSLAAQSTDRLLYCLAGLACLWADTAVPLTNQVLAATMFYYVQTHPGCNQSVSDKIESPLARLAELLPSDVLASAQAEAAAWHEGDLAQQVEVLLSSTPLFPSD